MRPWLKAALIGAAALVVLDLLGLLPCVGLLFCALGPVAYVGTGVLAAHYLPAPRDPGAAAGLGAAAAAIAASIGGIVNAALLALQAQIVGSAQILSQVPPELLDQWRELGLDEAVLDWSSSPAGVLTGGAACCAGGVVLAAILGAIGGAVYAGLKRE